MTDMPSAVALFSPRRAKGEKHQALRKNSHWFDQLCCKQQPLAPQLFFFLLVYNKLDKQASTI